MPDVETNNWNRSKYGGDIDKGFNKIRGFEDYERWFVKH